VVVVIFRSHLCEEHREEYGLVAPLMLELAKSMTGFLSFKNFFSDDGERISIVEFETLEHLQAWCDHPEHKKAQALGREKFYSQYHIQVCEPLYQRDFNRTATWVE
jgi:heme-degrading monooxygenase HmoA